MYILRALVIAGILLSVPLSYALGVEKDGTKNSPVKDSGKGVDSDKLYAQSYIKCVSKASLDEKHYTNVLHRCMETAGFPQSDSKVYGGYANKLETSE